MKKLLTLVAILPAVSLSVPCFGVDWVRDRIYTSSYTVLAILVIVSVITTQTA